MKKRIFIPYSIWFIFLEILFGGISIIGITIFIIEIIKPSGDLNSIDMIAIFIGTLIFLYTFFRFLFGFKIHLRKNDIATFGDGLPKFEKIQYKCVVKYIDIQNIAIVASEKNSKNQRIQLRWVSSSMPKKYLEFTLINGKKSRMCINYYTKKQILKMLKYINNNMQIAGNENTLNIEEIMKDWYAYGGYNREDLKIKRGEKIRKKKSKSSNSPIDQQSDITQQDKDRN